MDTLLRSLLSERTALPFLLFSFSRVWHLSWRLRLERGAVMRPPDRVHVYCILWFPCSRLGVSVSGFFITVSFVLQRVCCKHICFTHTRTRAHTRPHTEPSLPSPGVALACTSDRVNRPPARAYPSGRHRDRVASSPRCQTSYRRRSHSQRTN